MENLVDVFYYDYILYRIIDLYDKKAHKEEISMYCKIANVMNSRFTDLDLALDTETYVKTLVIKIQQLSGKSVEVRKVILPGLMEYLMYIIKKYSPEKREKLRMLTAVLSICYAYHFAGDPFVDPGHMDFIKQENGTTDYKRILENENLASKFEEGIFSDYCDAFVFGRPIMYDFVNRIKSDIENSKDWQSDKKRKVDVNTSSPGQKLAWN